MHRGTRRVGRRHRAATSPDHLDVAAAVTLMLAYCAFEREPVVVDTWGGHLVEHARRFALGPSADHRHDGYGRAGQKHAVCLAVLGDIDGAGAVLAELAHGLVD